MFIDSIQQARECYCDIRILRINKAGGGGKGAEQTGWEVEVET